MKRRAQAALEFLTTYGWAILIILVMVGAIAYFGVLNPSKFLPSKCMVSSEFSCDDFQIQGNVVRFVMRQGVGKTIYWDGTTCSFDDPVRGTVNATAGNTLGASGVSWSPRDAATLTCDFAAYPDTISAFKGEKAKVYFNMTYHVTASGLARTAEGEIFTQVQ